jgi:L-fuconolactonase
MTYNTIDAHQHFWIFNPVRDSWISDEMSVIQKDFLPVDLEVILKENGIDGSVVVQSDQSEEENNFHLKNAEQFDFIRGMVGWTDLTAEGLEAKLDYYSQFNKLKGFRHVLQSEKKRDFMLNPAFKKGINLLQKYDYTYDILIYPDQLPYVKELVKHFPKQFFIIDHLAKPAIKNNDIGQWKKDIGQVAEYENVYCKISGIVTEADWSNWKPDDFNPYIDSIVELFGTKRIMFGSDWPVCLVAGSYKQVKQIVEKYFESFSKPEKEDFFGRNAIEFYKL